MRERAWNEVSDGAGLFWRIWFRCGVNERLQSPCLEAVLLPIDHIYPQSNALSQTLHETCEIYVFDPICHHRPLLCLHCTDELF